MPELSIRGAGAPIRMSHQQEKKKEGSETGGGVEAKYRGGSGWKREGWGIAKGAGWWWWSFYESLLLALISGSIFGWVDGTDWGTGRKGGKSPLLDDRASRTANINTTRHAPSQVSVSRRTTEYNSAIALWPLQVSITLWLLVYCTLRDGHVSTIVLSCWLSVSFQTLQSNWTDGVKATSFCQPRLTRVSCGKNNEPPPLLFFTTMSCTYLLELGGLRAVVYHSVTRPPLSGINIPFTSRLISEKLFKLNPFW